MPNKMLWRIIRSDELIIRREVFEGSKVQAEIWIRGENRQKIWLPKV
jgi:hypothetical protein